MSSDNGHIPGENPTPPSSPVITLLASGGTPSPREQYESRDSREIPIQEPSEAPIEVAKISPEAAPSPEGVILVLSSPEPEMLIAAAPCSPIKLQSSPIEVLSSPIEVLSSPIEVLSSPIEVLSSPIEILSSPIEVLSSPEAAPCSIIVISSSPEPDQPSRNPPCPPSLLLQSPVSRSNRKRKRCPTHCGLKQNYMDKGKKRSKYDLSIIFEDELPEVFLERPQELYRNMESDQQKSNKAADPGKNGSPRSENSSD